jgi:hypothetical protein
LKPADLILDIGAENAGYHVTVVRMSEDEKDPAGTTQQFSAFQRKGEVDHAEPPGVNVGLIVVAIAVLGVLVALVLIYAGL